MDIHGFFGLQVAVDDEVLVAVCGGDTALASSLLNGWGQSVQQAKISNAVVAVLEPQCLRAAENLGLPAFQARLQVKLEE